MPLVDSTNTELLRRVQLATANGTVLPEGYSIRADFQTEGKGRLGRHWEASPAQNLTVSYLLSGVGIPLSSLVSLSQNLALAVRDTIEQFVAESACTIKWPNDIFIGDKKVAGILIETNVQTNKLAYAIAGIGINCEQQQYESAPNATSLSNYTSTNTKPTPNRVFDLLTQRVQFRIAELRQKLEAGQPTQIREEYHKHLYGKGAWLRYQRLDSGESFLAKLLGVSLDGKLELEHDAQTKRYDLNELRLLDK